MRAISRRCFNVAIAGVLVPVIAWGVPKLKGKDMESKSENPPLAIDEGMFVKINGIDQWITIRGADLSNPMLLMLHGGPGFPSSQLAPTYADWEKDFTLVQWDQPGGGATYGKNIGKDIGPLTIERYRQDGIAVAEFALKRLSVKNLVLYGMSWGTLLGVEMAQARPDIFSAYVGVSQTVGKRGRLVGYELALKMALDRGDKDAVEALKKAGPPPYDKFEDYIVRQQYVSPPGLPLKPEEQSAMEGLERGLSRPSDPNANYIAHGLPAYNGVEVFLSTIRQVFREEGRWDAWENGLEFKMPVFIFNGEYDINTPAQLAMNYCNEIKAPSKVCKIVPGAGHSTITSPVILSLLEKYVLPVLRSKK